MPRLRPYAWWRELGDDVDDVYPGARSDYCRGWHVSEALWLRAHRHLSELELAALPAEVFTRHFVYQHQPFTEAVWRNMLRRSQEITHYEYGGENLARIPYGAERWASPDDDDECPECGTPQGDFHLAGAFGAVTAMRPCPREQCPVCNYQDCRVHRDCKGCIK